MNFFYKVMGKATAVGVDAAVSAIGEGGMMEGELVMDAFKLSAYDLLIFTNKRIIRIEKKNVASQPWKNVRAWSYMEAGALDADSELYLHLVHKDEPLTIEFARDVNVVGVAANIGAAITGCPIRPLE